ncbi:ABC1 kinase family protein [Micromonospora sp. WMMA1923]|uniref:ABC1 kinase family protein n=1 Tax=Micromonospora sp. WMMA1923 TaxID=3404125 RepID=UPI003B958EDA
MALTVRAVTVGISCAARLLPAVAAAGVLQVVRGRAAARRHFYRRLVGQAQRLGPATVKVGQLMGTRRDILPAVLCDELGRLHDRVRPMTDRQFRTALTQAYGAQTDQVFARLDSTAVASGSIAGVYRATLPDGRDVAVKLRRPDIRRRMLLDLTLVHRFAVLAGRLPRLRGVPLAELVGFVCSAIQGQLDLAAEQENLLRLRANFADNEYVHVPEPVPEASRPGALVMEFIPELVTGQLASIVPQRRSQLAERTLGAVYQMLFLDGLVHCDLHPGNVYFRGPRVVVLDAGFTVRLPPTVRRQFGEFFLGLALGRGRRCGEVVVESAVEVAPDADVDGFVDRIADLVARNAGMPAREFDLAAFGTELFTLQRDFGLYAASEFVFPLLSLLVIEGTIRELDPDVDFQAVARPMLLRAAAANVHPPAADRRSA